MTEILHSQYFNFLGIIASILLVILGASMIWRAFVHGDSRDETISRLRAENLRLRGLLEDNHFASMAADEDRADSEPPTIVVLPENGPLEKPFMPAPRFTPPLP